MNLKNYWAPTPKKWRKIGDAILAAATFVSSYAVAEENKTLALCAIIAGAVGKFITNIFTDEPTPNNQNPSL